MEVLSQPVRSQRQEPLRRILKALPEPILSALVHGLDSAEEIVPGRLYTSGNGGCAVGVILRTIFPAHDTQARRFSWRRKNQTLRLVNPKLAKELPHLVTLEGVFDRTVRMAESAHPHLSNRDTAMICGRWVAAEAATELAFRELEALDRFATFKALRTPPSRAGQTAMAASA